MATARADFGLFELDGCMYAAGGYNGDDGAIAEVEMYDPISASWSAVSSMNQKRFAFGCCTGTLEMNLFDSIIAKAEARRSAVA